MELNFLPVNIGKKEGDTLWHKSRLEPHFVPFLEAYWAELFEAGLALNRD